MYVAVFIFVSESSYMVLSVYMVMGGGGEGGVGKNQVCVINFQANWKGGLPKHQSCPKEGSS